MNIPSIYQLKKSFQHLLRPLNQHLVHLGISANQVTLFAFFLSAFWGGALYLQPTSSFVLLGVPFVLLIRMALNAIDGMLAREHNMQSNLGTFLNELGDVLSDTALYLPFALHPLVPSSSLIFILFGAYLTEITGLIAPMIGVSRRYEGPFGKSDRAVAFALLAVLLSQAPTLSTWLIPYLLYLMLFLTLLTTLNRVRSALREAS